MAIEYYFKKVIQKEPKKTEKQLIVGFSWQFFQGLGKNEGFGHGRIDFWKKEGIKCIMIQVFDI